MIIEPTKFDETADYKIVKNRVRRDIGDAYLYQQGGLCYRQTPPYACVEYAEPVEIERVGPGDAWKRTEGRLTS